MKTREGPWSMFAEWLGTGTKAQAFTIAFVEWDYALIHLL